MKLVLIFLQSFFLLIVLNTVNGQAKEPGAEHKKLSALVGRWTLQGLEDRYLEICDMYQGGYFLVCNTEFKTKSGAVNKSVSIIGYSVEGKHITYYHYGSSGESQTLTGRTDEDGNFYFEGEEIIKGKLTKTRVAMKKAGENYNFKEETSVDKGPWTTSAEIVYIRLKQQMMMQKFNHQKILYKEGFQFESLLCNNELAVMPPVSGIAYSNILLHHHLF
jgi:hypothetical protein